MAQEKKWVRLKAVKTVSEHSKAYTNRQRSHAVVTLEASFQEGNGQTPAPSPWKA